MSDFMTSQGCTSTSEFMTSQGCKRIPQIITPAGCTTMSDFMTSEEYAHFLAYKIFMLDEYLCYFF